MYIQYTKHFDMITDSLKLPIYSRLWEMNEIYMHDFKSFAPLDTESVGVNFIQNNVTFL